MSMTLARGGHAAQTTTEWNVTLGTGATEKIEGTELQVDGGVLIIKKGTVLVVAFGIGGWVEVQPA